MPVSRQEGTLARKQTCVNKRFEGSQRNHFAVEWPAKVFDVTIEKNKLRVQMNRTRSTHGTDDQNCLSTIFETIDG